MTFSLALRNYLMELPAANSCCINAEKVMFSGEGLDVYTCKMCCKQNLLRAAFLVLGTMSDPNKTYHLEYTTKEQRLCEDLTELLFEMGLTPKVASRRGSFVIYFKNSEQIADLLNAMGCHGKMVEFWDIKLEKEVKNDANRAVNCVNHNTDKAVQASFEQITAIEKISSTAGLESLPDDLAAVCRARLDFKEYSLTELGRAMIPPISKSAVNHRMRRILAISREIE